MEFEIVFNAVTVPLMIAVIGIIVIGIFLTLAVKTGNDGFAYVVAFAVIVTVCFLTAAICNHVSRDYEELPVGTKVLLKTNFDDGVDVYKFSGEYGIVTDSSQETKKVDVDIIVSVVGNEIKTKRVEGIPRKCIHIVEDEEFYEKTFIQDPNAPTTQKSPTTQPSD